MVRNETSRSRLKWESDYALIHAGSVAEGDKQLTYFTMAAFEAVELASKLNVDKFSIIHTDSWAHFRENMSLAMDTAKSSSLAIRLI